jgi:hypothetical protein
MRKYLWAGTGLLLIALLTCYWLYDNGLLRLDALLTQGATSLGQAIGWTTKAAPVAKHRAKNDGKSVQPVPVPLNVEAPVKDLIEPVKLPDDVFLHAAPAQQPLEVIQVEGANPQIARAIFEHLIPRDLAYPPTLATRQENETPAKVMFTELRPNGPPRSQDVADGKEIQGIPFTAWEKENHEPDPSGGFDRVMPAADADDEFATVDNRAQARNGIVPVSHSPAAANPNTYGNMPYAKER